MGRKKGNKVLPEQGTFNFKDNIPNYPGYYLTPSGKLYRKLLKGWIEVHPSNIHGRSSVMIFDKEGERVRTGISRLVALVYIPNPYNKPFVCHKDNNPLNFSIDNLYWGTQKDNIQQCFHDGRLKPQGVKANTSDIQVEVVLDYMRGLDIKTIRNKYSIKESRIRSYIRKFNKPIKMKYSELKPGDKVILHTSDTRYGDEIKFVKSVGPKWIKLENFYRKVKFSVLDGTANDEMPGYEILIPQTSEEQEFNRVLNYLVEEVAPRYLNTLPLEKLKHLQRRWTNKILDASGKIS